MPIGTIGNKKALRKFSKQRKKKMKKKTRLKKRDPFSDGSHSVMDQITARKKIQ